MKQNKEHLIKTIVLDLVVVLLGLSYIGFRFLTLESRHLSPIEMLLDGLFGIAVGVSIKQALSEIGIIKGYETEEYKEQREKHSVACEESIDFIDCYDKYENETIADRKYKYRKTHLQGAKLRYCDFFEENGESKQVIITPFYKVRKEIRQKTYVKQENEFVLTYSQRKTLKRCYKVKIELLNLYSEYKKDTENFSDREERDEEQRGKVFSKNILSAVAFTLAGLYFAPKLLDFDWGSVIFASVQVLGFIITGITQMYGNINFVRVKKVNNLKEKTERLSVFINNCKKGKYNERVVKEEHE